MQNELRNVCPKEINGEIIDFPLMVTVTLEEYRWLLQENVHLNERVSYLENKLLEERTRCVNNAE